MKHFLFILLLISPLFIFAQINESDNLPFQIRLNTTGIYQQGNVNIFTVRNKIDLSFKPIKDIVFKSQNSSLYQEFSGKKADSDLFSRNYLYFKPERKLYPYAIGYISSNFRRKIDNRYFVGAGLTYQIIKQEKHNLKISSNVVYEHTNYKVATFNFPEYNGSDINQLWRGTLYLSGYNYIFDKKIKLLYDAFYQPSFDDRKDYRAEFEIGLEFPVYKGLSFNSTFRYAKENIVPLNTKQEDKILTFGLTYNYKKSK